MAPRWTLPAETTSFVGREPDLLRLEQAFAEGARLVTVMGPPGIGKSRLATRYAARCLEAATYPGGVIACEVVDAVSAEDLCAALRRAVDVAVGRGPRGGDVVAELGMRLGDMLVLLDNAEQLAKVGPETIGRWLSISPRVRFLVTSRERLRLAGEVVHELGPLSLPGEGAARSEAVQLFVERARAARPQFAVTAENTGTIEEIVAQLDGIPLAIELGASRMGVLSPSKLLARLRDRFAILAATIRNPGPRQRTLREAIETSFALLSPHELAALAQVSIFRGGFTVEGAEAVVDLGAHPAAPALVDVLQSLVDRSLLYTRSSGDEVRFGMYLSIRDHAAARLLESGGAAALLSRYASCFLAVAALATPEVEGPAELERMQRTAQEMHNLIAVHGHLLEAAASEPARAAEALRIALALEPSLARWGPLSILQTMLDSALRAAGDAVPAALRLRALIARGNARRLLGKQSESLADHESALALAERTGDSVTKAIAEAGIGMVLRELGRLPEAQRRLESALPELRRGGARRAEAHARAALERLYTAMGRGDEAAVHREEVRRLLGDERDGELVASSRVIAAQVAIAEGRLADAELDLEKALAEVRARSAPGLEAHALNVLVLLRHEQGRLAEARACAEASISLARRLGNGRIEAYSLGQLGAVLVEIGDLAGARDALTRATALLRDTGDARAGAFYSALLGATCGLLGHEAEGARLFRSLDGSLAEVGDAMLSAAVDVYRAVLEPARAAEASAAARERAARSTHLRVGLRILAATRSGRGAEAQSPGALVMSPDARHCRLPDGTEVSFRRGRALRLMLLRLFEERLAAPGRALSRQALFASGWPGERASGEAQENRVYVTVSRLRKLGFAGLIVSRDDGFLLDPNVPAYRADT